MTLFKWLLPKWQRAQIEEQRFLVEALSVENQTLRKQVDTLLPLTMISGAWFVIGERVDKVNGWKGTGEVRAFFTRKNGDRFYVVEFDDAIADELPTTVDERDLRRASR
jgi:hypothetical protein